MAVENPFPNDLPSLRNGSWFRCADGSIIEPLDLLHLIFFPNRGKDARGDNVCFLPSHIRISYLDKFVPQATEPGYLYTQDDFIDCTLALLIVSFVLTLAMIGGKYLWEVLDKNFNTVAPSHKKWYVVANICKAFFLGCMAVSPKYWIGVYTSQVLDDFQMLELKRSVVLYVATDLVALFMVPKLPTSTIVHHVATTTLCFIVFGLDLQLKGRAGILGFAKMGLLYGSLSTLPYLVNAYLALRVVYPKSEFVKKLCCTSLVVYLICCCFNWSIHILWLFGYWGNREFSIFTFLYSLILFSMVHDDIVLIKWLVRRNSPANAKND